MRLRLDHHSGEPIYRQIVEQVKFQVACGRLKDGGKLPSIRTLAAQLKINPRTVVKAYEELRNAGLAVMKQGQGVFVSAGRGAAPASVRRKAIADQAARLLAEASRMGADPEEVVEIVRKVAEEMEERDEGLGVGTSS